MFVEESQINNSCYSTRERSTSCSSSSSGVDSDGDSSFCVPSLSPSATLRSKRMKTAANSSLDVDLPGAIKERLSTDGSISRESLLDELLGDIRRHSCATSLASTPSMMLSLSEGETENVFECKLRRSEAELRSLSMNIFVAS